MKTKAAATVWACALALSAPEFVAPVASAQRTGASIDIGGLNMRYADSVDANAVAITPSVWSEADLSSLSATGTFSQMSQGGWSAQGGADASFFTPRIGWLLGEIEGRAGGSARRDGSRTGQTLASARAHLAGRDRGVWVGGGVGTTWDGSGWRTVRQGEAAAWTRVDALTAFASVTPVEVDNSTRYTDTQLSGGLNLPSVELSATGGFRSGANVPVLEGSAKSWGSASVTAWIAPKLAIVASAGTYPIDLTQGYPGGRFASLSIRLGARRFLAESASVSRLDNLRSVSRSVTREAAEIKAFETRKAGSGTRELKVFAPRAGTIEVTGDFTDWQPVRLTAGNGGWWSVALPVTTGIHEMNLRIDGGPWTVPPGMTVRADEFGGVVGILVVR